MSKKRFKKGIKSLKEEIEIHRNIKLKEALETGNEELVAYYEKEIERKEEEEMKRGLKLLPRKQRLKIKKLSKKESKKEVE